MTPQNEATFGPRDIIWSSLFDNEELNTKIF